MNYGRPEFFSAILIISKDVARLAKFYREVLDIPLEDEKHGNTEPHYGCELGDIHFAIHPFENFKDQEPAVGSVKLALEVFDIDAFAAKVTGAGAELLYPPKPMGGIGRITALRDPDGNLLEFTELNERWIKHVEGRRKQGIDMLDRWKAKPGIPR